MNVYSELKIAKPINNDHETNNKYYTNAIEICVHNKVAYLYSVQ
jgi:hemerythrin superfamily protein